MNTLKFQSCHVLEPGRIGFSILGLAALFGFTGCGKSVSTAEVTPMAPLAVTIAQPIEREVTDYDEFNGRTAAVESVEIRARVSGYLDAIHFEDGEPVEQKQLLFEIDPRPYQAAVDSTQAALERTKAGAQLASVELKRAEELFRKNALPRNDLDKAIAAEAESSATVQAAQARLEEAQLDLNFTKVHSPIEGRVGREQISVGNLVTADNTLLTSVVSMEPIYVYFSVNERALLDYIRKARANRGEDVSPETIKEAAIPVEVGLAGDSGFPLRGVIDFADNRVETSTGTIQTRAVLPNDDRLLLPGLFTRVRVASNEPYQALLVPELAIMTDQGRKYVLTVNDKEEVEYRPVELGTLLDDELRVIKSGLAPEDRVIINGMLRVRPGMVVDAQVEALQTPASPETDS